MHFLILKQNVESKLDFLSALLMIILYLITLHCKVLI